MMVVLQVSVDTWSARQLALSGLVKISACHWHLVVMVPQRRQQLRATQHMTTRVFFMLPRVGMVACKRFADM